MDEIIASAHINSFCFTLSLSFTLGVSILPTFIGAMALMNFDKHTIIKYLVNSMYWHSVPDIVT